MGALSSPLHADDSYFYDILQNTNKAVESVIILPDGTWVNKDINTDHPDAKLNNNNALRPSIKSFTAPKAEAISLDSDDEDIGAPTPSSLPPAQSQNTSISVRPRPSRKRTPAQFVDLTLTNEEDHAPPVCARPDPPPTKRMRVDPQITTQRSTLETNGVNPSLRRSTKEDYRMFQSPYFSTDASRTNIKSPRNPNLINRYYPGTGLLQSPYFSTDSTNYRKHSRNTHPTKDARVSDRSIGGVFRLHVYDFL